MLLGSRSNWGTTLSDQLDTKGDQKKTKRVHFLTNEVMGLLLEIIPDMTCRGRVATQGEMKKEIDKAGWPFDN